MTRRPIGELAQHPHFVTDSAQRDRAASRLVSSSGTSSESLSDDLSVQLESLQRLVYELLIKNQQLRIALMEKGSEAANADAHLE